MVFRNLYNLNWSLKLYIKNWSVSLKVCWIVGYIFVFCAVPLAGESFWLSPANSMSKVQSYKLIYFYYMSRYFYVCYLVLFAYRLVTKHGESLLTFTLKVGNMCSRRPYQTRWWILFMNSAPFGFPHYFVYWISTWIKLHAFTKNLCLNFLWFWKKCLRILVAMQRKLIFSVGLFYILVYHCAQIVGSIFHR